MPLEAPSLRQDPLPLVPIEVLKKHQVYEKYDNRFRSCARLLQACWRAEQGLPIGEYADRSGRKRRIGSLLGTIAADIGRNFMSPAVAHVARRAVAYQEAGAMIDHRRLFANLLSSMPLCFNLFAPMTLDLDLAKRVVLRLFTDADVQEVTDVWFEHSPGRQRSDLTGDRSAFDVAIVYLRADGQRGFIGFEVKFSESLHDAAPSELNSCYDGLAEASGLFKNPMSALLRVAPLQQLFREHLLAQAAVMRGDWTEATFAVVAPVENHLVQRGAELYSAHLTPPLEGQVRFANITLDRFIDAIGLAGEGDYAAALLNRYCAWWKLDEIVEQALRTKGKEWRCAPARSSSPVTLVAKAA